MSTPRSTDPKARAAASLLSGRLRQCWEATFDWDLLPRGLREVCYKNNVTTFIARYVDYSSVNRPNVLGSVEFIKTLSFMSGMPPSWKSHQHAPSCSFGWTPPYSQFCDVPFNSTSRRHRLDGTSIAMDFHLHAHRKWQVSSLQVPQVSCG